MSNNTSNQTNICMNMNITNVNVNLNLDMGVDMQLDQFMSQMDNLAFSKNFGGNSSNFSKGKQHSAADLSGGFM